MPTYSKDAVEFPKDIHDAFFKFSFEHNHDQHSMVDRLVNSDEFDGDLEPLNRAGYYELIKAVFCGYKPVLTKEEQLLEAIEVAKREISAIKPSDTSIRTHHARFLDGLKYAAKIMEVK